MSYLHQQSKTSPTTFDSIPSSNNNHPSSSSSSKKKKSYQILYQKVLHLQQRQQKTSSNKKSPIIQLLSLPQIIHYLQSEFTLPSTLHIPFKTFLISEDENSIVDDDDDMKNNNNNNIQQSPAILYWDSSLSPSIDLSRLYVEVVPIFPYSNIEVEPQNNNSENNNNELSLFPTMAMIVVKKIKGMDIDSSKSSSSSSSSSIMIQNLIIDSHQKIIKSLDKCLNDIEYENNNNSYSHSSSSSSRWIQQQQPMNTTSSSSIIMMKQKIENNNRTIRDDVSSSFNHQENNNVTNNKSTLLSSIQKKTTTTSTTLEEEDDEEEDFAIAAVKKKIKNSLLKKMDNNNDFVITSSLATTKKVVISKQQQQKQQQSIIKKRINQQQSMIENIIMDDKDDLSVITNNTTSKTQIQDQNHTITTSTTTTSTTTTIPKKTLKSKASTKITKITTTLTKAKELLSVTKKKASKGSINFRVSISKPKDFNVLTSSTRDRKEEDLKEVQEMENKKSIFPKIKEEAETATTAATLIVDTTETLSFNKTKRNINIQLDDTLINLDQPLHIPNVSFIHSIVNNTSNRSDISMSSSLPSKEEEANLWKTAIDMMPTLSDNESLTPQQLWENVIQFGEESKKQDLDGQGFVQGVLQKSKELLGNQRTTTTKNPKKVKEMSQDILGMMTSTTTAEDELKKIFAAGEQIIEGKIMSSNIKSNIYSSSTQSSSSSKSQVVTEEYVDELIDIESTVSKNVKSLDDELAELEIRISRTVGERSYDTGTNPLFDVFSGPREYNPNVDPETSVNWPGAPMGTRTDVRLPSELANALKQAQFAAEALSQLREDDEMRFFIGSKQVTKSQVDQLRFIVEESVAMGLISDPIEILAQSSRLQMILDEMKWQPDERFEEIVSNYRDLLLSDHFPHIIRSKLVDMAKKESKVQKTGGSTLELESLHKRERDTMTRLVNYAQLLLKEAQALGAELENNQLEIIRSICLVAMDPQHTTEEETSLALAEAVRDMRPLLDENFVAYLKYAISEEEASLARRGVLDDPEHNRWLFVLKIVQEGVYSELSKSIRRYIDHISYVLRMETKADRRALLSKLIDAMPSLDVRPFVKCVDNIAASLGSAVKGEFRDDMLGGMTNKILQLRRDVHELLPPDRIKLKSQDADEWVENQRQKLLERRNASLQRLQTGKDMEKYDDDKLFRPRGDVERMT